MDDGPQAAEETRGLRPYLLTAVVVGSAYFVAYVSTVRTRTLFGGDTRYYAAMALRFGGTDRQAAAAQVAHYASGLGLVTPPPDVLFGWGLVQPRVVLP